MTKLFSLYLFFCFPLSATIFISGEVLYWKSHENGLAFAFKSKGNSSYVDDGKTINPDFGRDVGYRLGIGITLPRKGWDLILLATHFHNYVHTSVQAAGEFLFPTWINAAADGPGSIEKAKTRWRLHLGMLDLSVGKWLSPCKWLQLRPNVGVKGIIARQKYEISYQRGSLFPHGEDEVHMKNKFWGVGPEIGIETDWTIWRHLSIYANSALSTLFGHFYIHQSEYATVGQKRRLRIFDTFDLVRAVFDLSAGIQWAKHFSKHFALTAFIGWDFHILFGQNQLIRFVDNQVAGSYVSNQGDLTLEGLTGGLKFNF